MFSTEYTEMVGKLQEAFDTAVDRYLEAEISTDEEVAVEFPENKREGEENHPKLQNTPLHLVTGNVLFVLHDKYKILLKLLPALKGNECYLKS